MGRKASSVEIDSERMEWLLELRGLSKQQLGKMIGYSRETISKSINSGKMDRGLLNEICKWLDVHPDYIKGKPVPQAGDLDEFSYRTYSRDNRIDILGNVIVSYDYYVMDHLDRTAKDALLLALKREPRNIDFTVKEGNVSKRVSNLDDYFEAYIDDFRSAFRIMIAEHLRQHWEEWTNKTEE